MPAPTAMIASLAPTRESSASSNGYIAPVQICTARVSESSAVGGGAGGVRPFESRSRASSRQPSETLSPRSDATLGVAICCPRKFRLDLECDVREVSFGRLGFDGGAPAMRLSHSQRQRMVFGFRWWLVPDLTGAARCEAQASALEFVKQLWLPIRVAIENPIGTALYSVAEADEGVAAVDVRTRRDEWQRVSGCAVAASMPTHRRMICSARRSRKSASKGCTCCHRARTAEKSAARRSPASKRDASLRSVGGGGGARRGRKPSDDRSEV